MLFVDLGEVRRGPVAVDVQVEPPDQVFADVEYAISAPVVLRGRLSESGRDEYYFTGRLTTQVIVPCRRCLREVPTGIDAELGALFTEEDSDDPAAYPLVKEDGALDLRAMVRETLLLHMPEYPLCRDDCKGLCARCGADWNEGPCECRSEPDRRWAALQALTARTDESEES